MNLFAMKFVELKLHFKACHGLSIHKYMTKWLEMHFKILNNSQYTEIFQDLFLFLRGKTP